MACAVSRVFLGFGISTTIAASCNKSILEGHAEVGAPGAGALRGLDLGCGVANLRERRRESVHYCPNSGGREGNTIFAVCLSGVTSLSSRSGRVRSEFATLRSRCQDVCGPSFQVGKSASGLSSFLSQKIFMRS
jgi:hypothetical protein